MSNRLNLVNGNFITMDRINPIAEKITIYNGKISGINTIDIKGKYIDLQGATIIPGFTDAHFHLVNFGKQLDTLQLKDCKSPQEIVSKVLIKSRVSKTNGWIIGFGWDQTIWKTNKFPNENFLNDLSISQPIILTRIDGHSCWVNQKALQISGIDITSKPPQGGQIINNCILIDNAMNPMKKIIPKPDETVIKQWIKSAFDIIVSRGITNIHDAWQDSITVKILKELNNNAALPIRIYGMLGSSYPELIDQFFKNGYFTSEKYTIRSVKAFIDGALGSRGAALLEPYSDEKNNCGLIVITKDEFRALALKCRESGFQLCTHAIGDRGNQMVLDVYSEIIKNKMNHRWRIEHAQMVCDEDIPRFAKNGIIPSMQPSHCTSDMRWLDKRIGLHRVARISRWKTFIDAGCKIPGGSDCPIEEGNPLFEYYAAITRQNHNLLPKGGWQKQEIVNRIDALKMFTTWAAYGEFSELNRGKIKLGFDADITVLSNDITQCSPQDILNTKVLMTIVNGKIVYSKI